jgi:hypothetical protein
LEGVSGISPGSNRIGPQTVPGKPYVPNSQICQFEKSHLFLHYT